MNAVAVNPLQKENQAEARRNSEFWKESVTSNEYREKMSIRASSKNNELEYKEKMSKIILGVWKDPNKSQNILDGMHEFWNNPIRASETKNKMSKVHKELWGNEEWAKEAYDRFNKKPTKPEIFLNMFLDNEFPGEWKYVGDGEIWIGGKNPDFININEKKLIIEMFGDYWHKNDDPKDRIDYFRQYGYETFVIWERELKEENSIKNLINFCLREDL